MRSFSHIDENSDARHDVVDGNKRLSGSYRVLAIAFAFRTASNA